jgi:hypothetical protein
MKHKNWLLLIVWLLAFGYWALPVRAQFSFYLIDNFESGKADKWYRFSNAQMKVTQNPSPEAKDVIADSCGTYALKVRGGTESWFVGGVGTDLGIDATPFSRLQMDIYGSGSGGKLRIELFDDDNNNFSLEQDPALDWKPTKDDKWYAEVPVLEKGFTRFSIPFSAFKLDNPGCGDGIWNPDQKNGSGGLLKMQIILLTDKQKGQVDANIDNILLTY